MRFPRLAFLAVAQLALVADTQIPPAIDPGSFVNAASRMPSALPGGALARGSRFSLSGVRLGPQHVVRGGESKPPPMLASVSVDIVQGQAHVPASILLASATRIDGLIPMSAPLGPVRITVTYNGQTSEPYAITLVDSSFGFFTPDTAPDGLLEAHRLVSASPGQNIALFGTGLGNARPQIFVAGKPVAARIQNEDCCQGVSRVELKLPASVPLGCYVPIQARAGGRPSNVIGIAIHTPGEACHDQFEWFKESARATRSGFVALARVSMGDDQFDYAVAAFANQQVGQRPFPSLPPFGTCLVTSGQTNPHLLVSEARSPANWARIPNQTPGSRGLDAGASIAISGAGGVKVLQRELRRNTYSALLGGAVPLTEVPRTPLFLAPGDYDVSSPGGKDVGPFDVRVPVQRVIEWKNRGRAAEVQRSVGVTLDWKEVNRNDAVLIAAASTDRVTGDSSISVCLAYAKDRRFQIPGISLENLPPTLHDDIPASFLLIAELPLQPPVSIRARGLDAAFATFLSIDARLVRFK